MEKERKLKLLNYLYPTEDAREFFCKDLYLELLNIIPKKCLISCSNENAYTRKRNYEFAFSQIEEFLGKNADYLTIVLKFYNYDKVNAKKVCQDVLIGLTLYSSHLITKYSNIDIFLNKKSVCYEPISIVDFL